jgi:hypothetical protein
VGDHRSLWKRGRPRRVQQREDVVGTHGGHRVLLPGADHVGHAQAAGIGIVGVHEHVTQVRKAGAVELAGHGIAQLRDHRVQDLEVIHGAEVIGDEQGGRVGLAKDIGELAGSVARVQRDDDDAELGRRILRDEPERAVGQPDGERVALDEAEGGQAAREGVHAVAEPGERDALAAEHDRLTVRMVARRPREHVVHGGVGERVHHAAYWIR